MIENLRKRYWAWHKQRETRERCNEGLARLQSSTHPRASDLHKSVYNVVHRKLARKDKDIIAQIESLRASLATSTDTIEHIDYGAGEPSAPRDMAEARKGVAATFEIAQLATHTSKASPWSDIIYSLVRNLRPQKCLELGTCIGLSAAYQCAAMTQNGEGGLVTLEGGPNFAETARSNLSSLGYSNFKIILGPFADTLEPTLEQEQPIDFVFNDGHHDGAAMLKYFEETLPYFSDGSVMLFDDIAIYQSMRDGWKALAKHPMIDLSIDFGSMGLVYVNKNATQHVSFSIPID